MEVLQLLTKSIYDDVSAVIEQRGGSCVMEINPYGDLDLVCHWPERRSWRMAVKRYHTFDRMEGWVDLKMAEKIVALAEMNKEKPIVAIVFPDGCVEFYSIITGRRVGW